ncbi:threonine--tRNA ligase, partial [Patescibacteria group bacterium]|nr:threonine--tRNA ligase [Patescibacteria group bacterium]
DSKWEQAENTLKEVLEESGFNDYVYDIGGAVFYGPKIDIKVSDAIGRKWQLSTIQFDFNLPAKFGMTYVGEDGQDHTPFMIHRALLGSLERFLGVLIEHYAGAFPAWLAPVPVVIIPVAKTHEEYAQKIHQEMREKGIRAEIYESNETLGKRIREAEMNKIPYMAVIGDKEVESKSLAIRNYATKKQDTVKTTEFIKKMQDTIKNPSYN